MEDDRNAIILIFLKTGDFRANFSPKENRRISITNIDKFYLRRSALTFPTSRKQSNDQKTETLNTGFNTILPIFEKWKNTKNKIPIKSIK